MTIVKANTDAMAQYTSFWEEMQQNIKDQIAALQKLAEEAANVALNIYQSTLPITNPLARGDIHFCLNFLKAA